MERYIHVGVSAIHIHLSQADLSTLFGSGYELKSLKELSQPNQFAAVETVAVVGPKGQFSKVRILGPVRPFTQIELSQSDAFAIGISTVVRESGDIAGSAGCRVIGPAGELELIQGVIVAARHIHFHPSDAERWGITDRQLLKVRVPGARGLIFEQVLARVSTQYKLDFHIDTDEGNAAGLRTGDQVELLIE